MPLYEFECKSCKKNLMKALGLLEKKYDKKVSADFNKNEKYHLLLKKTIMNL